MKIKWTEIKSLHSIPEMYWGEDLSEWDRHYEGEVISTVRSFWSNTYFVVHCTDGIFRECEISKATVI